MKKSGQLLLRLTAVVLSVSFVLSGCLGGKRTGQSSKAPVSISIWHYYNGVQKQSFDDLVAEFNDTVGAEQGIVVEAYNKGYVNDLSRQVIAAANQDVGAEEVPDVFAAYADTAYEVYRRGMTADIGAYLTEEEKNSYIPAYMEEGRFSKNGQTVIFPIAKSTEVFMLNTTDWQPFAEATGASVESFATWEGLAEVAEEYYRWTDSLTPEKDDGKAFFGRDALANYLLIGSYQLGSELFDVIDGQVFLRIDEEIMRRLWDNYYVPYVNGYYTAIGRFRSDDAKTGDILALVGSSAGAPYFPGTVTLSDGEAYEVESAVYPPPNFAGAKPSAVQQGAGMVVTKSEPRREAAAVTFLKWFTRPEQNLRFCLCSGYLPVTKAANTQEALEQAADNQQIVTPLKQALFTGIEMVNGRYQLYTNQAFEKGDQARSVVNLSLQNRAEEDREKVRRLMDQGLSRQKAVARVATDQAFQEWLADFTRELEAAVG